MILELEVAVAEPEMGSRIVRVDRDLAYDSHGDGFDALLQDSATGAPSLAGSPPQGPQSIVPYGADGKAMNTQGIHGPMAYASRAR